MEIKELLEKAHSGSSVSIALVYRWHPTKLKYYCKTYRNHGKFDVECVEFTVTWCLTDCDVYCTVHSIKWFVCWECIFCHNRINAIITFATSECSAYLQVMFFVWPLRLVKCSHMIDILHIGRNKVDVSSHVISCISSILPLICFVSIVCEHLS